MFEAQNYANLTVVEIVAKLLYRQEKYQFFYDFCSANIDKNVLSHLYTHA